MDNYKIQRIGQSILNHLVAAYTNKQHFYLGDRIGEFLDEDEDSMMISNDDIINYMRKILSDEYSIIEIPTERIFKATKEEDSFKYFDTELKLIKND